MSISAPRQLPLDLGHRAALGREDFLVTDCNAKAVAWIDRWPDWPQGKLLIFGPVGSGKSHLLEVWRHASFGKVVSAQSLVTTRPSDLLADHKHLAIDDVEDLLGLGARGEEALFHLYNEMTTGEASLLILSRWPAAELAFTLPDLASRLKAINAVGIAPPDDDLLAAVMVKLLADRQLRTSGEVISFALARLERSFEAVANFVEALDKAALAEKRDITVPLARSVLKA